MSSFDEESEGPVLEQRLVSFDTPENEYLKKAELGELMDAMRRLHEEEKILRGGKIFRNDSISEITKLLEGKIYEAAVTESVYMKLKERYQILTVRQISEGTYIRFVCGEGLPFVGSPSEANLEDVFLYLYQ